MIHDEQLSLRKLVASTKAYFVRQKDILVWGFGSSLLVACYFLYFEVILF
jgi:hypothetical protein